MFGFIEKVDGVEIVHDGFNMMSDADKVLDELAQRDVDKNDGKIREYGEQFWYMLPVPARRVDGKIDNCDYTHTNGRWEEITQKLYWYFLEVLPPIYGPKGAFAVSEPVRHTKEGRAVYTVCVRVGERFFATIGTYQQMQLGQLGEMPA